MDMQDWRISAVVDYWDAVAARYLDLFQGEFGEKPFDREVIGDFADRLGAGARVVDVGCGPCAEVTRLLADGGLAVTGIDISPRCVDLARTQEPALSFEVADMAQMPFDDGRLEGLVAYYALHYQPKATLTGVLREFRRVLRPGGRLLIVAKAGDGEGWIDDPLRVTGKVFWSALDAPALQDVIAGCGFTVLNCEARAPLDHEIDARRIYLTAERA